MMLMNPPLQRPTEERPNFSKDEVLADFQLCYLSRKVSVSIRREVLTGKAKFGIGGSGKEVLQVAMAKAFQKGDFFSGYYRDQTFMMAKGLAAPKDLFAMLYADAENDPYSAGRQMNNHFSTSLVDEEGNWTKHKERYNVASAISSLGGQIPHALGIALASKLYRQHELLSQDTPFSNEGNEVSFCVLGDATSSEGVFFETVNAAGVMQVPMAFIIQDDGYGISVPTALQTTKGSISELLEGFRLNDQGEGLDIYRVKAWDYEGLCEVFQRGIEKIRHSHIPAIFHIEECTQPHGHSTSGSHERYKSKERLQWEKDQDGIAKFETWILEQGIASEEELAQLKQEAKIIERSERKMAWEATRIPVKKALSEIEQLYEQLIPKSAVPNELTVLRQELTQLHNPSWSELVHHAEQMQLLNLGADDEGTKQLHDWLERAYLTAKERYEPHLHSETAQAALKVRGIPAEYDENAPIKNGFEILNAFFDQALERYPNLYAFGEDVGKIGDVNQAFAGLQQKYGEDRVFDTGIREWTIVGQGIGMAMRGLRPIAEIQYIDYLPYAFSALTDDLATLRYRSNGQQMAPVIIRTRGHRLEGIWHSGSPMGMLINSMRGIYLLTPRNMTQAAGLYNTLLQSDDPAIMIECLNGYRLKEKMPNNLHSFSVPLGVPEVLQQGTDVTLVTYGSCVRIAQAGLQLLASKGISVELIDVQTLLPFDIHHIILDSLKKTNRIVFMDEDVPGGATAYMMQQVLEHQGGYHYLDSPPTTLTAKAHRPPFGDDGDYFSKPNAMEVFRVVYEMMGEVSPGVY